MYSHNDVVFLQVLPRSYSKVYRHLISTDGTWDKGEGDTVILVTAEQCGTTVVQIVERLAEEGIEALSVSTVVIVTVIDLLLGIEQ